MSLRARLKDFRPSDTTSVFYFCTGCNTIEETTKEWFPKDSVGLCLKVGFRVMLVRCE